ncbi:MAG: ATP-binding cassette domain-containing protein [Parabacteroides merdae]
MKKILDNISFSIGREEKIVLLGNNGAGKSTLIDIITQDINPTKGNVFLVIHQNFPKIELAFCMVVYHSFLT